jgi:hypothetical protein
MSVFGMEELQIDILLVNIVFVSLFWPCLVVSYLPRYSENTV